MSVKEIALDTISHLPDDADWAAVRDRLDFVAGVQRGLDELEAGKGIPVEEIEQELKAWITR